MRFRDRADAGRRLAQRLLRYKDKEPVVYGLARGGVVIAAEIARVLHAPMEALILRKIGHPLSPEYAIGAVTEAGHLLVNEEVSVPPSWLQTAIAEERAEAKRRREVYMGDRAPLSMQGKTAILADDGIATGLTMRLAIAEARERSPRQIIVAVPVVPQDAVGWLREAADELVALCVPTNYLGAVGAYYNDFQAVEDEEVIRLLRENSLR